jgi:hypothetical protein
VRFRPDESVFQAYALFIEPMNSGGEAPFFWPRGRENTMTHGTKKLIPKLRKSPQPPLSHRGATPDSDRAKRPRLAEPSATGEELNPGDRVEGLGNFGMPTGELGTVEQTNEEDAVVKWDDDGRKRLHQPWLKKVLPVNEHRLA